MKSRTKSNSTAIINALLKRGLTAQQAAREAGISNDIFGNLIRSDRHCSIKVASKLRAAFGSDAVTVTEPAQV